jgi:Matrixin
VNPSNADMPDAEAIDAIRQGAFAWSSQSNAAVSFNYLGTTTGTTVSYNSRNEVMFRNATNGSAAATTYTYYSGGRIVDADVVIWDAAFQFYPGSDGCSGGVYLQDISAHEFGHVAGLAHSAVAEATMYPTIGWCSQSMRSLATDDQEGIEALYPAPGTNTPPSVTITAPVSDSVFNSGVAVALSGAATDQQDGNLSGAISWRSSIDGPLGAGSTLSVFLSAGTHAITATVTDRAGATASTSEAVVINQPGAAPASLVLSARGYKIKGLQAADLTWSGAVSASVDLYRDGVRLTTTVNDGSQTDAINRKGSGTYKYRVCEAGGSTCSNDVTVVF